MFHIFKVSTHHGHEEGRLFSYLSMLLGFTSAVFWAVLPSYVGLFSGNNISLTLFFALIGVSSFAGALASTIIFRHFKRVLIFKVSLLIYSLIFALMVFVSNYGTLLVLEMIRNFVNVLIWIALALFVRDFSNENELGRSEGRFFLFINVGFILGFALSSIIMSFSSYNFNFYLASLVGIITFLYFSYQHVVYKNRINDKTERTTVSDFFNNFKDYFKNIRRTKSFLTGFSLHYWLIMSAIFFPIFIELKGFSNSVVGYVLAASIIPLIFMEEWSGSKSDYSSMKYYLFLGFFFLSIISFWLGSNPSPILMIILMVISGFGVGIIEPLQEKHFFNITTKSEEEKFYGVRMTAQPLASIFAPLFATLTLGFFGLSGGWIITGIILLAACFVVLSFRKSI